MVRMGEVLCIQPRDEASRILFYNETRLVCPVDPDIVALWAGVRIPQNQDSLDAELIKCKTMVADSFYHRIFHY